MAVHHEVADADANLESIDAPNSINELSPGSNMLDGGLTSHAPMRKTKIAPYKACSPPNAAHGLLERSSRVRQIPAMAQLTTPTAMLMMTVRATRLS